MKVVIFVRVFSLRGGMSDVIRDGYVAKRYAYHGGTRSLMMHEITWVIMVFS